VAAGGIGVSGSQTEALQAAYEGMTIETGHAWGPLDFVGGLTCLDFTNTGGGHTKVREVERIPTYGDVVNWSLYAEVLKGSEAKALLALAKARLKDANHGVRELHTFRESLHRLVSALVRGEAPADADFTRIRGTIAKAVAAAELARGETEFVWSVDADRLGLGTVIARVALSAHHMLSHENPAQLRQCERCTWLFIDRTKNQMRRFCRQDACGNKARAERFYGKKRKS
jgi:predicted RNA-binding Zn ribbon-like protein